MYVHVHTHTHTHTHTNVTVAVLCSTIDASNAVRLRLSSEASIYSICYYMTVVLPKIPLLFLKTAGSVMNWNAKYCDHLNSRVRTYPHKLCKAFWNTFIGYGC